jgi:hypothetical protein
MMLCLKQNLTHTTRPSAKDPERKLKQVTPGQDPTVS